MTILRSREIPSVSGKPRPKRQSSDIIQPSTPARKQEPSAPSLDRSSPPTNTFRRRRSPRLESLNGFTEKEVSILVCSNRKSNVGERFLSLRSGKKVANGIETSGSEIDSRKLDLVEETNIVSKELDNSGDDALVRSEEKGKSVMAEVNDVEMKCDEKPSSSVNRRKYTREEKAKGIQVENLSPPITTVGVEEMDIDNSIDIQNPPEGASLTKSSVNAQNQNGNASRNQQFRDFAERNASRFARFDVEMEEEEESSDKEEVELQVEDWPGPFSTAMKIMKDREENTILHDGVPFSSDIERSSSPIVWPPRRSDSFTSPPPRAPSLQELSMRVLVKNADAITSLDYVPDSLRVKLCQLLCDSRRMDVHFLDLLVRGSPTGICVPDCSWLTEEQFTECFKNCDTSNLMVLQLDQCGRCMPDYVLPSTLARSPKSLPMLSSLSLSGACRLSDVGLRALVSVAPAITSINLSQCSLLTSSTIDMLSDSLGLVLRELYLNECQSIDLKLILTALKKFEKLEVLSLVDLPSVRGRLLREFITARGQALKQLTLSNSVKLTDSSIKDISENCPNLRVLDLANVCKLTDCALGYLANGCQFLEKLIFCRNSFSDEAVAAFVETSGGSLVELSLNNVKKVGHNTALALAKFSEKLQILDVSWCRDMSDNALGYIVDSCSSLKVLKVFGCTQITDTFVLGHSNPNVEILGLKMDPFLNHLTKNHPDS
ncbi:PREDICTED: uncharacterized protein LOC106305922 [Brassica oleracea var. oleracea]|uniref:F-box/LRR-repeat protein 15-like leucin rich repeat domain-containing protein n=1 Tax=Brassica oleracea var. oleracea TaxID=109376 RepID=A0A0D3D4B5_BRAOL|nr:PREDICTED: uncharacterized protein LOC106305922 [Brassica oleracea var. oleracea]